jgi:hypothetical protein
MCGHATCIAFVGRRFRRYVAVCSPSAQKRPGREAWISKVRMTLLMERMIHSALPFCGDVYGHDIRSCLPFDKRKIRVEELSNSRPLSHWMTLTFLPN